MLTTIKGEINTNTIVRGGFNTPFSPMDRPSRNIINKETQILNDTINQVDLIDTRTFHLKASEYTSFSSAHGTFSRTDQILATNQASVNLRKLKL